MDRGRPFYPSLFTLRMYTSGMDLDSGLGWLEQSRGALLKRPQKLFQCKHHAQACLSHRHPELLRTMQDLPDFCSLSRDHLKVSFLAPSASHVSACDDPFGSMDIDLRSQPRKCQSSDYVLCTRVSTVHRKRVLIPRLPPPTDARMHVMI